MLKKTEWIMNNGQSRETDFIGHIKHRTKTNKKPKTTTQDEQQGSWENRRMSSGALELSHHCIVQTSALVGRRLM